MREDTNWCAVAGGLGLQLPNFVPHDLPGRWIKWTVAVGIVRSVSQLKHASGWLLDAIEDANCLARADVMEDA